MAFRNQSVSMQSGTIKRTLPTTSSGRHAAMTHYRTKGKVRRRLGLGTTSAMVAGGLNYGSAVVPVSNLRRAIIIPRAPIQIGPAYPVASLTWGATPPPRGGSRGYGSSNVPASQNNLAQLLLQYQSNPSSLTASQWQQLQAAGAIPGTVPYSNAALDNPLSSSAAQSTSGAIDPATGVPYSQELAAAQAAPASSIIGTDPTTGATTILGIDWYWLAGLAVAAYVFTGKRGR